MSKKRKWYAINNITKARSTWGLQARKDLWKTMMVRSFAKGTFLIRFSKTDAALPVLVVSNSVSTTPSKYKDDICFCYQTVRKGMLDRDSN